MGYFQTKEFKKQIFHPHLLSPSFFPHRVTESVRGGWRRSMHPWSLKITMKLVPTNYDISTGLGIRNELLMCYTLSVIYCWATSHSKTLRLTIAAIIYFTHRTLIWIGLCRDSVSWFTRHQLGQNHWKTHFQDRSVTWLVSQCWVSARSSARVEEWRPQLLSILTLHWLLAFLKKQCFNSQRKCPKRQTVETNTFLKFGLRNWHNITCWSNCHRAQNQGHRV